VWDYAGVIGEPGERALGGDTLPGAEWFPDATLNFAANLLRRTDDAPAIIFRREDGQRRVRTFADLHAEVGRIQAALTAAGVVAGDRVAAYLPNIPEAITAMLACAAIGAVWSSCSPDFGVPGVLDRFGQIEPKVLLTVDGYLYKGKRFDLKPKVVEVLAGLPTVEQTVVFGYTQDAPDLEGIRAAVAWNDWLGPEGSAPQFAPLPFAQPLYILFSSGTTGKPKCIVHGAGGTLLQHLKEHALHTDVRRDEVVFYFTTTGWMMWNWLVSALAVEATIVLFDGNPMHPGPQALVDMAAEEKINVFGTSAKFVDAIKKAGLQPAESHDLSALRTLCSTGSPLVPESFDYVMSDFRPGVQIASISGGTDIVSCFVLGCPIRPVRRGEIQCRGLGMAVEVWHPDGTPAAIGEQGELVCTKAFPSAPVGVPRRLLRLLRPRCRPQRRVAPRRLVQPHGARRLRHLRPQRRHAQPGRRAHRHGGDLPRGGAARRNRRGHRDRAGHPRRRPAHRALLPHGGGRRADGGIAADHPHPHPRQQHAPPRAGGDLHGHRHPAHPQRQDQRTGRAQRGPRPPGQEHRSARQPRSARAVRRRPAGASVPEVKPMVPPSQAGGLHPPDPLLAATGGRGGERETGGGKQRAT
jgi:acyl-coenzyme A synthetase/AMP-(fatty) acid ligase